ncbi:metallophosphoesterase [Compostibacter hankyongensis]|uniref:Metallophosphoesterase n=1 Tax=Compostibacter hankyongensis TaxID=1007089 RepID=A0ABP8G3W3_9BACT
MKSSNLSCNLKKAIVTGMLACPFTYSFGQKFTIPVFPDTQTEISKDPEMLFSQVNWIKEHKDSLHIPIALHVGDVVDFNNHSQWEYASEAFDILDEAGVPYAITVGNHDTHAIGLHSGSAAPGNVNANLRNTDKFNSYFPIYRFKKQRGRFEENKSDNAYYTFRAGGLDWLVLTLEFTSRRDPINWADEVVASHPSFNVIIVTHYFLNPDGSIGQRNAGYGNLSPQEINDFLVKKYPNILMVLSGHVDGSAWHVEKGDKGNNVYEILQDFQGKKYGMGGGYLRLLEIDTQAKSISAKIYSPYHDKEMGGTSTFSFSNVDFITKFPTGEALND